QQHGERIRRRGAAAGRPRIAIGGLVRLADRLRRLAGELAHEGLPAHRLDQVAVEAVAAEPPQVVALLGREEDEEARLPGAVVAAAAAVAAAVAAVAGIAAGGTAGVLPAAEPGGAVAEPVVDQHNVAFV